MSAYAKVVTFNTGTGTGNLSAITGLPSTPKAIFFFAVGLTSAGNAVHGTLGLGAAVSTASRFAIAQGAQDNTGGVSNTGSEAATDCCLAEWDAVNDVLAGKLDIASFDANGFTPTVDVAFTVDTKVIAYVVGGSDLAAQIGSVTSNATGDQSYTPFSFGIAPSFVFLARVGDTGTGAPIRTSFGMFTEDAQACWAGHAADAQTNSGDIRSMISTSAALLDLSTAADTVAITWTPAATAMVTNGFTLNRSATTSDRTIHCVGLTGGQHKITTFAAQTGTGNFSATGAGFTPIGLLAMSRTPVTATQTVPTGNVELTLGAATASGEQAGVWTSVRDAVSGTTDANQTLSTTRIFVDRAVNGGTTDEGEISFVSFSSDGATLNQDTASGAAVLIGAWWIAGNAGAAGAISGTSAGAATVTGTLTGTGLLAGTSAGVATVTGVLGDVVGQVSIPDATISAGDWVNELASATDLHLSVDEYPTANDADYIESGVTASTVRLRMSDILPPEFTP